MARIRYTDEWSVLELIQNFGRTEGFNGLSGCDLSGLDFSEKRIQELIPVAVEKYRRWPVWASTGATQRDTDLERIRREQSARDEREVAQKRGAYFRGLVLTDSVLVGTNMDGADLQGVNLDHANLRSTILTNARLWDAWIRDARLRNVHLGSGTALQHADLTASSLLGAIAIDQRVLWLGATLYRTAMERELVEGHIGEEARGYIFDARRVYSALRLNFDSLGQRSDALWAYLKEKEMDRGTLFYFHDATGDPDQRLEKLLSRPVFKGDKAIKFYVDERKQAGKRRTWFRIVERPLICIKLFFCPDKVESPTTDGDRVAVKRLSFLLSCLQGFLWGYGVSPARVLRSLLLVYLILVGVHSLVGSLTSLTSTSGLERIGHYLLLSLLSLTTMSWPGLGQSQLTSIGSLIVGIESGLGVLFFALLVFTLGRRIAA